MKLNYSIFFALCCLSTGLVFGVLDAIFEKQTGSVTDILIIGFALAWSIDKEVQKDAAKNRHN